MSKAKASREAPQPMRLINPFAWTDAVLKGGEAILASMQETAARVARVGVIPTADAPPKPKIRKAAPKPRRRSQASRQVVRRKSRRAARS